MSFDSLCHLRVLCASVVNLNAPHTQSPELTLYLNFLSRVTRSQKAPRGAD